MSADIVRHLEDHEKHAKLSAGERAALRHKFKFNGLHYTHDKLLMSDEQFSELVAKVRSHSVDESKAKSSSNHTAPKSAPHLRTVKE